MSFIFPQFDNKSVQSFTEDDIVNMYPIVKHINPRWVPSPSIKTKSSNSFSHFPIVQGNWRLKLLHNWTVQDPAGFPQGKNRQICS